MGYDEGGCVECDLTGYSGTYDNMSRYCICMGCLQDISKYSCEIGHGGFSKRLWNVLKNNVLFEETCDKCDREMPLVFEVDVCQRHQDTSYCHYYEDEDK